MGVAPAERRPHRGDDVGAPPTSLARMPEFDNESVATIENTLNDVDRALERLRVGSYRACQVCGESIEEADVNQQVGN